MYERPKANHDLRLDTSRGVQALAQRACSATELEGAEASGRAQSGHTPSLDQSLLTHLPQTKPHHFTRADCASQCVPQSASAPICAKVVQRR